MKIQHESVGDESMLFALDGELDAYTGPQLREELGKAAEAGCKWLLLDLTAVQYIDSVGLGILVGAAKRVAEKHGDVAVIGPRPNVLRVFEVSGTKELLNVVPSLEEARQRLQLPACPEQTSGEGN